MYEYNCYHMVKINKIKIKANLLKKLKVQWSEEVRIERLRLRFLFNSTFISLLSLTMFQAELMFVQQYVLY